MCGARFASPSLSFHRAHTANAALRHQRTWQSIWPTDSVLQLRFFHSCTLAFPVFDVASLAHVIIKGDTTICSAYC